MVLPAVFARLEIGQIYALLPAEDGRIALKLKRGEVLTAADLRVYDNQPHFPRRAP